MTYSVDVLIILLVTQYIDVRPTERCSTFASLFIRDSPRSCVRISTVLKDFIFHVWTEILHIIHTYVHNIVALGKPRNRGRLFRCTLVLAQEFAGNQLYKRGILLHRCGQEERIK